MNRRTRALATCLLLLQGACLGNGASPNHAATTLADPGAVVLRRLNRAEYINSVRDLITVTGLSAGQLPADTQTYGFDNIGSGLTLAPADTEAYQTVAEAAAAVAAVAGSPGFQHLVACDPAAPDCLNQTLQNLASHAWRRPVTVDEVTALSAVAANASDDPNGFTAQLQLGIVAVLMSPHFLFKVEVDPAPASTQAHLVSPYELATRLSYFLWSSVPDDALLDAAAANALQTDAQLAAQVTRMLADPKAAAFSQNFAGQWLEIRLAQLAKPDATLYPTFDANLQTAMVSETQLFFDSLLHGSAPLSDLLTADYTFINDRLAAHYGLPAPNSQTLVRVSLPPTQRRGLMTQAAVLLATSHPDAGAPVLRGKYILAQLLCQSPPPPPASVPPLSSTVLNANATMRQRLEAHVTTATCAACHSSMDPLGYAYEGFDAIGAARTTDHGQPVDTTGTLPGGGSFAGPFDLATLLGQDPRLNPCAVQQLVTYALGRGTTPGDSATLLRLTNDFATGGQQLGQLITRIVLSNEFRARRGGN